MSFLRHSGQHQITSESIRVNTILDDLNNKTIDVVDLQHHPISSVDLARILIVIKEEQQVKTLDLSGCGLQDNNAALIATFLRGNKTITTLILTDNKITAQGFAHIADALSDPTHFETRRNLIRFKLIYPEVSHLTFDPDELIPTASWDLGINKTLRKLDVAHNQITDISLKRLQHLALGSHLTTLNCKNNPLNNETKNSLATVQPYCPNVITYHDPEIRSYISQHSNRR